MANAASLLQAATAHHQAGRWLDAEKVYKKILRIEPLNVDALRLLGGLYLQNRRLELAVEYLTKASRLSLPDVEILTNLAIALQGSGKSADAKEKYEKALAIEPSFVPAINNLASLQHETGHALEALNLYKRSLELQPHNPVALYNLANSLFVVGNVGAAISQYERALQLKPDYLEAMINLGMALSHAGRRDQSKQWLETASTWFDRALQADPHNVVALNNLGNVTRQLGNPAKAIEYYRTALKANPHYVQASINMATSLRDLGRIDEAIDCCRSALTISSESADARINLGTFLQQRSQHVEALELFEEALLRKPASIDALWNKAISLLALGKYEEGWALHEVGLGVAHMRGEGNAKQKRWRGSELKDKRLLIRAEQGFGDNLQFIRYAELCKARGGVIIVHCPASLRRLFRCCPFVDDLPDTIKDEDFDFEIPMMSLPLIFQTTLSTIPNNIPYLFVSKETQKRWDQILGMSARKRVGLVWAGNPREQQLGAHMIDRRRSMSLEILKPLLNTPGIDFYSLQKGEAANQIETYGLQGQIIDHTGLIEDFEDTAALINRLDLVISVDTSVVHLAGGLGRPVWVLSRFDACWRWLQNQPHSPWYSTVQIFGQEIPGDWGAVLNGVQNALSLIALQ